jgi:hypothetical protein
MCEYSTLFNLPINKTVSQLIVLVKWLSAAAGLSVLGEIPVLCISTRRTFFSLHSRSNLAWYMIIRS